MNNGGIESIDALSKDSQSPPLPKPQIRMQHQFLIFVLWLCFLIRGVFYCSVLPLWDGFDEWAHFAVADYMSATRNALVDRDMRVSKEINLSLQLVPLPRGMTAIIPPGVRREVYWVFRLRNENVANALCVSCPWSGLVNPRRGGCRPMKPVRHRSTIGYLQ